MNKTMIRLYYTKVNKEMIPMILVMMTKVMFMTRALANSLFKPFFIIICPVQKWSSAKNHL